jgi:hypothetical protein
MMMKSLPHRLPGARHDLQGQAHAVRIVAAPLIGALVGVQRQKLVDEIALGAHDLDPVVARLARLRRTVDEGADLPLHAPAGERKRGERGDGRLDARRRHRQRVVAIAPGVQDLQCDLAAGLVHRIGDDAMAPRRARGGQSPGKGLGPAGDVGRKAAGDDQAHLPFGALAKVGGQFAEVAAVFQTGVHRAHEHTVADLREAQIQRLEKVRIEGQAGLGRMGVCCKHEERGPVRAMPPS